MTNNYLTRGLQGRLCRRLLWWIRAWLCAWKTWRLRTRLSDWRIIKKRIQDWEGHESDVIVWSWVKMKTQAYLPRGLTRRTHNRLCTGLRTWLLWWNHRRLFYKWWNNKEQGYTKGSIYCLIIGQFHDCSFHTWWLFWWLWARVIAGLAWWLRTWLPVTIINHEMNIRVRGRISKKRQRYFGKQQNIRT